MTRPAAQADIDVQVQTRGAVAADSTAYAEQKIRSLSHLISVPVLSARVRLTESADRAVERPAVAQANLDLNGRQLRAHVAAATMREAIDALEDRVATQLDRLAPGWESPQRAKAASAERQRRDDEQRRAEFVPVRAENRTVVRHKAFSLPRVTPDRAALDMEMLDYDFHLFTDLTTGQDSVLIREGSGSYRLLQLHPRDDTAPTSDPQLARSPFPAPVLTEQEAVERLELSGLRFVFFEDVETGRGNVLYHRYDGDYGLIIPAD